MSEEERLEDIAHWRWLGRQDALHALIGELFAYDEGADIYLLLDTPGVDGWKMGRLFGKILWEGMEEYKR